MKKNQLPLLVSLLALALAGCSGGVSSSLSSSESKGGDSASSQSDSASSSSTGDSSSKENTSSGGSSSNTGGSSSNSSNNSSGGNSSSNSSSDGSSSSSSGPDLPIISGKVTFTGVGEASCPVGQYFDSLKDVKATLEDGTDVTKLLNVIGTVQYGKIGDYQLTYRISSGDIDQKVSRNVHVKEATISRPTRNRTRDGEAKTVNVGSGSYRTGSISPKAEGKGNDFGYAMSPDFVDNELYNEGPLPSNKWYSAYLVENYGGSASPTNTPLTTRFGTSGLSVSYRGVHFTEYYSVADTFGVQQTTMSNHANIFDDMWIKPSTLNATSYSRLIGYSENSADIAMRNTMEGADEMVTHLVEGSPYCVTEFKDSSNITINLRTNGGILSPYEFYDVAGNKITSSYTGTGLVVKFPQSHTGYAMNYPSTALGAAQYEDRYFLLSAPEGSTFALANQYHASAAYLDKISISMTGGNYLSVASLPSKEEATFYQKGAYSLLRKGTAGYEIDAKTSTVTSTYYENVVQLDGEAETHPIMAVYPHQWKKNNSLKGTHSFKTFRGTSYLYEGSAIVYSDSFRGLLPSFALPETSSMSKADMTGYLNKVIEDTVPGDISLAWKDSDKHFINAPGPYWTSKASYPLSQALIVANQLGLTDIESTIKTRLKGLISDWYTYSGDNDVRFLYYDNIWGSMYYSVDNFSTNARMSDHHFTSGYIVYASAVLAMYDTSFMTEYGEMAKLLLLDYMNNGESGDFPILRNFDTYASHSFADGIADFGDGNDQESCGESLNGWTAGYLFGIASGDSSLIEAGIYGYTSELNAIKQYWFNYDEDNWDPALADHTHAIGILWSGKNDYATWFGSNPEFIYGIHWLPTGEYLTGYALSNSELSVFTKIYNELVTKCGGAPRTWFSNFYAIEAIVNPSKALTDFNGSKITGDDYPDEVVGSYNMVTALGAVGNKDYSAYSSTSLEVASSVYSKNGASTLMAWNPSNEEKIVKVSLHGAEKSVTVAAHSFLTSAI